MKLTRGTVKNIEMPAEDGREATIWDDEIAGFGLRVRGGQPKSRARWILQYRIGRKQRKITFGALGEMPPDAAREKAKDLLAAVRLGQDPSQQKQERQARASDTFAAMMKKFLARQEERLSESWYADTKRYLEQHCKSLHGLPMHAIKRATIADVLGGVASDSGLVAADRCRAALHTFFTWAMKDGAVEANPVAATNKYAGNVSRKRVLTGSEIAAVWQSLPTDDDYGDIVRLLILTGQRRDEVAGMAWSEIEAPAHLWKIPEERTKNGLPHEVPLSDMAWAIVSGIPRYKGRDLCFGSGLGPYQGFSKSKARIDEAVAAAGTKIPHWTVRDIRRTVATGMGDLGVLPHVVEAVLNHVSGSKSGVAGIYNKAMYRGEKAAAMAVWAEYVAGLIVKA